MSGTRHHFIPRFLQRGFASRVVGDTVFTWVFRRDKPPFESNTINVGAEGHFYADQDSDADPQVTSEEPRFASLVDGLRGTRQTQPIGDARQLAELITHLMKRTRAVRRGMKQVFGRLITALVSHMEGPELEQILVKYLTANPAVLRGALVKCGVDEHLLSTAEPYILSHLPELAPILAAGLRPLLHRLRHEAPKLLETASKSGHIQAIERISTEMPPPEWLSSLSYEVRTLETPALVLGDSTIVVVARRSDGSVGFRAMWESPEVLLAVVLPLRPDSCLVGRVPSYELDLESIPAACARSSSEFFIAGANTAAARALHPLIATGEPLMAGLDIDAIVREAGWN